MPEPRINVVYVAPGALEGPLAERSFGEVKIEIWAKVGHRQRFDPRVHPRRAREAADKRPETAPNPCLVPLDEETQTEGGPFIYARVFVGA